MKRNTPWLASASMFAASVVMLQSELNATEQSATPGSVSQKYSSSTIAAPSTEEAVVRTIAQWKSGVSTSKMSPDGKWMLFVQSGLDPNATFEELDKETPAKAAAWLQRISSEGEIDAKKVPLPIATDEPMFTSWRPDSRLVAVKLSADALMVYDPQSAMRTSLPVYDVETNSGRSSARPRIKAFQITATVGRGKWSADCRFAAFIAPIENPQSRLVRHPWKATKEDGASFLKPARTGLFVYEASSGEIHQVSPSTVSVVSLDWSPDAASFVIEVENETDKDGWGGRRTDLAILDRKSGALRYLVTQKGSDEAEPSWSPDGKLIAFVLHSGDASYRPPVSGMSSPTLAIVSATGGEVIKFPKDKDDGAGGVGPYGWALEPEWSNDSRSIFYWRFYNMRPVYKRAAVIEVRTETLVSPDVGFELSHLNPYYLQVSSDERLMAFQAESPTQPPETFITKLRKHRKPIGPVHQVTHAHAGFIEARQVKIQDVQWPSMDGKFTIHGLLYTPKVAWKGSSVRTPLPTVVSVPGGPGRISAQYFGESVLMPELALAIRGYAVLVPATRGRGGDYSDAFAYAIRDDKSDVRLPYFDVMSGVDWLISKGIADPNRLGIHGHSYGGILTNYAIAQTTRFKAAILLEGGDYNRLSSRWFGVRKGDKQEQLFRNQGGQSNPFDPEELNQRIAESALFHAYKVKTPTLLIMGSGSAGGSLGEVGVPVYNALRRFDVPAVLLSYDMGHSPDWPGEGVHGGKQLADIHVRVIEWFDYWLQDIPSTNPEHSDQFEDFSAPRTDTSTVRTRE